MQELDDLADEYLSKINSQPKEMKKWEIVNYIKNQVEQFRQTLPLIKMLREKYMRARHWEKLQKHLGAILDYESDTFTLQEIFRINLLSYQDSVREVCEVAREEYKIESALALIDSKWQQLNLNMDEHPSKKGFYKLKKTEDIYQTLEDHMAILSAQKTTLFYDSFRTEIEAWENLLLNIQETLDTLLQVQRQWIYLEAIFASQDNDQDKQFSGDKHNFQKVEKQFQKHMQEIYEIRNAKATLSKEGLLKELQDMTLKLEESQKKLNDLLERNRKDFPRFYFLSNDDLFEILGNSKDPSRVNKHIKKCFEGIKKLDFVQTPALTSNKGQKQDLFDVVRMTSPDGEVVPFLNGKVPCEFGVEKWLKQVELKMVDTLKHLLTTCISQVQKKQPFRWVEKWMQTFPGQLLILTSQIYWTKDCFEVLSGKPDKPK